MADKLEKYILKISGGDMNALKKLYDVFGHAVYSLSLTILKDRQLAEDCSQEVFIKIASGAGTYHSGQNTKAWVMGITRNEAINVLRKQKGIIYSDFLTEDGQESSKLKEHAVLEDDVCARISLEALFQRLDVTSQQILMMHLVSDLKFREISEIMNIPLGTITWKYQIALKKLKCHLVKGDENSYEYIV
jgi:RNA polymerase sigma factor (sigma-70 family)